MATSGYIQTNTNFGYVKLEWTRTSVDVANNTSTISYTHWIHRNSNISSTAAKSYSVVINGSTVASGTTTIGGTGDKTIKTGTVVIPHNADGSKTFSYSFSQQCDIDFNGWVGTVTGSGSSTLDPIARASQPTLSVSSVDYGGAVTIYTNRADSGFTHTLRYSWNSLDGTIATGVGTSYAWTVPTSFMNEIPNATSSWGTIYCDTYNGSTLIGTKTVTLTTTVPSSVVPTFTSVTAADTATAVTNLAVGSYVQSLSLPKFTINGAAGAYSSTISKYEFTFEGSTYSGNPYTMTTAIKGSGTISVSATITDSRGRTATQSLNLTVLAYAPPVIKSFTVSRCNSDGTANDMGTSAKVERNGTWTTLNAKNTLTITVYSRVRGTTTWTQNNSAAVGTSGSYNSNLIAGTFAATSSYDFRIDFIDKFNTTMSLTVLSTGQVTMSLGKTGVGIGKIWESGALDLAGDANISGNINLVGSLMLGSLKISPNAGQSAGSDNLDTTYSVGRYNYNPATVGAPTNGYGVVDVIVSSGDTWNGSNNWLYQIAYTTDNPMRILVRNRINAGSWSPWQEQTPQYGSNGNGNYLRFNNGIQFCWAYWEVTDQAINSAYGSLYQGTRNWTFPAAFKSGSVPTAICSEFKWDTSASFGTISSASTATNTTLRGIDAYSRASGTICRIGAFAVGWWK